MAIWDKPDYGECEHHWPYDKAPPPPPQCPYDTSYDTRWYKVNVNTTATAKCPANLQEVTGSVRATRWCQGVTVYSKQVSFIGCRSILKQN